MNMGRKWENNTDQHRGIMKYKEKGAEIGALIEQKNRAYGNSFQEAGGIIKILYPKGIRTDQYDDMLAVIRICDKLFRIATEKDAFGESPWHDIAGYAILKAVQDDSAIDEKLNRDGNNK